MRIFQYRSIVNQPEAPQVVPCSLADGPTGRSLGDHSARLRQVSSLFEQPRSELHGRFEFCAVGSGRDQQSASPAEAHHVVQAGFALDVDDSVGRPWRRGLTAGEQRDGVKTRSQNFNIYKNFRIVSCPLLGHDTAN